MSKEVGEMVRSRDVVQAEGSARTEGARRATGVRADGATAGLDLGAREELVSLLGRFAASPTAPATIMVTHHVDEIPPGFTHALLLRDGQVLSSGLIAQVLTQERLSACFGLPLKLEHRDGRWLAWGASG